VLDAVQPPGGHVICDCAVTETERAQLAPRNDPVLAPREVRERDVRGGWC